MFIRTIWYIILRQFHYEKKILFIFVIKNKILWIINWRFFKLQIWTKMYDTGVQKKMAPVQKKWHPLKKMTPAAKKCHPLQKNDTPQKK